MRTIVTMSDRGRITIPAGVREALHLQADAQLQLDVVDDTLVITPAMTIPRDDAWAYTPEHLASVARARDQPAFAVSPEELAAVIDRRQSASSGASPDCETCGWLTIGRSS